MEEALALKFQWASSRVYQNLLGSLNIDLKSVSFDKFIFTAFVLASS